MRFARRLFLTSGIYGLIVMTPLYVIEQRVGSDHPPAITHPEYYYGFAGVGIAWQLMFLVIASDPVRYRMAMLPAATWARPGMQAPSVANSGSSSAAVWQLRTVCTSVTRSIRYSIVGSCVRSPIESTHASASPSVNSALASQA